MNYNEIKNILAEHGQLHLLRYYNELDAEKQTILLKQLEDIDWNLLDLLKDHKDTEEVRGRLEPLGAMEIGEIEANRTKFEALGTKALQEQKIGAVLLAGGQGTRLGFDKPKGMFNVGITHELYIFECLIRNLMEVVNKIGAWIPLYIMTSDKNNADTVAFLHEKNFFGYNKDYIHFFIQDMAPSVSYDGKILMEDKHLISLSPNGNGGWFHSMMRGGLVSEMKETGIEWLTVFAVDNVLQRINDPTWIGAVIDSGCDCGGKVVRKADPQERVGVLCLEDEKPSIVEYYEMTDDMIHLKDENGNLLYNFGVILNYMFRLDKLEDIISKKMDVHIVEKKIPFIDENGILVHPDEPNGYKFELLVLDMIHMMDSCLPYEVVRRKEFAPIKNPTGVDSVESARELLIENGVSL